MKIAIGADHRGFDTKETLKKKLESHKHMIVDCGTHSTESCDYPDIAYDVARHVSEGKVERGILVCMSGIGMAITANKVSGVRAALCHNLKSAMLSREHNDANVLVLASQEASDELGEIVNVWLTTPFEGGRHQRRVDKIKDIDNRRGKE